MQNGLIWKIVKAGKWSAVHFKAFIVTTLILIVLVLFAFIAYHNYQCQQGKHDKLSIRFLLFEHECNNCKSDSINNTFTNNGTIGIASNGSGKVDGQI